MRLLVALLAVALIGVGAIFFQTDRFTVVTTEAARRNNVARHPRFIPDASLYTSNGAADSMLRMLESDGRVAIVDFIYTRCLSICLAMGSEFQQLQTYIEKNGLGDKVRLLSISFDPTDDAVRLGEYAKQMQANSRFWMFATPTRQEERRALLKTFGIVVIPAELGQFEHNAAYHVVTPDGQLARVVDFNEQGLALDYALSLYAANRVPQTRRAISSTAALTDSN